jgi:hypothetical protein
MVPIVITVLIQTGVAVWWAGGVSSDVSYLKRYVEETSNAINNINATRFPVGEEQEYRRSINARMERMEDRLRLLETRDRYR